MKFYFWVFFNGKQLFWLTISWILMVVYVFFYLNAIKGCFDNFWRFRFARQLEWQKVLFSIVYLNVLSGWFIFSVLFQLVLNYSIEKNKDWIQNSSTKKKSLNFKVILNANSHCFLSCELCDFFISLSLSIFSNALVRNMSAGLTPFTLMLTNVVCTVKTAFSFLFSFIRLCGLEDSL